jgi:hypothetical protein
MAAKRVRSSRRESRYRNPATRAKDLASDAPQRYPSGYRMSDRFITVVSTVLSITMLVLVGLGFLLGLVFDNSADWVAPTAISLILGGIGLPLLVAAWLGGQALHRFGGPVGALLIVGFAGIVLGTTNHLLAIGLIGGGVVAVSIVLFWVMGRKAGVRMFLGPRSF